MVVHDGYGLKTRGEVGRGQRSPHDGFVVLARPLWAGGATLGTVDVSRLSSHVSHQHAHTHAEAWVVCHNRVSTHTLSSFSPSLVG